MEEFNRGRPIDDRVIHEKSTSKVLIKSAVFLIRVHILINKIDISCTSNNAG